MRIAVQAISLVAVSLSLASCTSTPRIGAATLKDGATQAGGYEKRARAAVASGDLAGALNLAENAVEAAPRDLGYRMLLADLYLKNGRFRSAEQAFRDVLHLSPDNGRAAFSLALAEMAEGKRHSALTRLEQLAHTMSAADLGLAFALAGDSARAIQMLEGAARMSGADARVRQNLALAYALGGDWQRARITAEQDLAPTDVAMRMAEWASFARPASSAAQVAALLGVKVVEDAGQPAQLALAPETREIGPAAPVLVAEAALPHEQVTEPVAIVAPQVVQVAAPAPRAPKTSSSAKPAAARYVVQLGAYASSNNLRQGWSELRRRYALQGVPHGAAASVPGKGKLFRLSVGYQSQSEAIRTCRAIKSKGGGCFVRGVAGDRPIMV